MVLAWFYCSVGASLTIVSRILEVQSSKISLLCYHYTIKYRPEINKSHPRLVAAPKQG